jgi:hypothetical protein
MPAESRVALPGGSVDDRRGRISGFHAELCRLAIEFDRVSSLLDAEDLSRGESALMWAPTAHIGIAYERLQEIAYEREDKLDDRPRRERLRLLRSKTAA